MRFGDEQFDVTESAVAASTSHAQIRSRGCQTRPDRYAGRTAPRPRARGSDELFTVRRKIPLLQVIRYHLRFRFDGKEVLGVVTEVARIGNRDFTGLQRFCQREAHSDFEIATVIMFGLAFTAYA